jgi:hypothetical protein
MNFENMDYKCYREAVAEAKAYRRDWLREGYAPLGFYVKDFCLHEVAGEWHLYHIAGTPGVSCGLPGNEVFFGHATTRDFMHWETHEACFFIDVRGWDHGHVFAPHVITHAGRHWMFYTGVATDNTQRIGLAVSDDLFRWERVGERPIIRPEEYGWAFCPTTGGAACRDAHVIAHEGRFELYYTAVTREGHGCVARASSIDLREWRDEGVVYGFHAWNQCESSNVQRRGDEWLLFFGGHHAWSYVASNNHYRWPNVPATVLREDITGMEVIRRHGERWLVAYFGLADYRLRVGVLDWAAARPTIVDITTPEGLREFGLGEDGKSG